MDLFKKPISKLLIIFVVWRMLLFGAAAIANKVLPYRPDFAYTSYSFYLHQPLSGAQKFIEPWANFDGVHYLHIAERGYIDEVRFFPVLPMLIYLASWGHPHLVLVVGFILAQLLTFAALYTLYLLLRLDYDESVANKTIIVLLAFPTSFFLGAVYTESLFLLLSVLGLYAARQQLWRKSGLIALLLSATRITGIVLVPTLLIELWSQSKTKFIYEWKKICLILLGDVGILIFAAYLGKFHHDPLLFLKAQTQLGNSRSIGLLLPIQTCFRYAKILTTLSPKIYEWWVALLEVGTFLFATTLLTMAWFRKVRKSYWWWAFLAFIIPAMSGTFTGMPRYILPLFPIFLPIVLAKQNWVRYIYLALAIPLLLLFTALFTRGYFIA